MPRLLPTLAVADVLPGGTGFRYRLIGTRITGLAGRDATSRMIDAELYGADLDRMIAPYMRVVAENAPVLTRSCILFSESWRSSDNMFVPFTRGSGGVDVVMVSVSISDEVFAGDRTTGQITVISD